jgi:hypothetical protein
MAEEKKGKAKAKPRKMKVISHHYKGDFEKLYEEFVNKKDVKVLREDYVFRNNEYVCFVGFEETV